MLVKILGGFDVFVALILFLMAVNINIHTRLIVFLIIILLIKAIPSLGSFCVGSVIDTIVVIILVISIFVDLNVLFLFAVAFAIGQKGAMSFL